MVIGIGGRKYASTYIYSFASGLPNFAVVVFATTHSYNNSVLKNAYTLLIDNGKYKEQGRIRINLYPLLNAKTITIEKITLNIDRK